jgi:GT2 family glycosyltransferase
MARQEESDNALSVSVIIPTKDRHEDLELTVQSVLAQTVLPKQLIVVDQSSGSESRERLEAFHASLPKSIPRAVELTCVHDSKISGAAAARNRAMEAASGDIWLFLDDDVELEPSFIEELLTAYSSNPKACGISGIIVNYPLPPQKFRTWSRIFCVGPFHDERQPIYWAAEELRNTAPIPVRKLGGGLMSFRASVIQGVRFDENLVGASLAEDWDFCVRLRPGSLLLIAPRARLLHKHSPTGRSHDFWVVKYAQSSSYLFYHNWRTSLVYRLCFCWLQVGLAMVAAAACVTQRSSGPWHALRAGAEKGRNLGRSR